MEVTKRMLPRSAVAAAIDLVYLVCLASLVYQVGSYR